MLSEPLSPAVSVSAGEECIAHILYMDIVGYSLLPSTLQLGHMARLQETVRATLEFTAATQRKVLITKPKGDGMALIFFSDMLAPLRCAVEIATFLRQRQAADWENREQPANPAHALRLRMGVHSGPVMRTVDINGDPEVQGEAIVTAQRVMDCGDADHILVSAALAELLATVRPWSLYLHDIQLGSIKYGKFVHLYNFYSSQFGNSRLPMRMAVPRIDVALETPRIVYVNSGANKRRSRLPIVAMAAATCGFFLMPQNRARLAAMTAFVASITQPDTSLPRAMPPVAAPPDKTVVSTHRIPDNSGGNGATKHGSPRPSPRVKRRLFNPTGVEPQVNTQKRLIDTPAPPSTPAPAPSPEEDLAVHECNLHAIIPVEGHVTVSFSDLEGHHSPFESDEFLAGQRLPIHFTYKGSTINLVIKYGNGMEWRGDINPQQLRRIELGASNG